ncbi:MAG: DUF6278 family protein [Streptosporangiaceae bacterium]
MSQRRLLSRRKGRQTPRPWRRWLRGPKHGIARGVAVWGGSEADAGSLADTLASCPTLRSWAAARSITLDGTPGSLDALDSATATADEHGQRALDAEGALYLGTVLVRQLPGARWHVWPNGHPVIRLVSGRDLDVVAVVSHRMRAGSRELAVVYQQEAGTAPDLG